MKLALFSKAIVASMVLSFTALTASPAQAQAQAKPLEKIDYLFPAPLNQIAFAPWFVAQQRGYYAKEGYELNFLGGRGGVDTAKQIGAGNVVIGHSFGDAPIITRPNGVPIKSVALLGGRSMMQVVVREDSNITSPAGLRGKTITAMSFSDANFYSLLGVLASAGLKRSDVETEAVGPAGVWQLFAAGKAQAMAAVPEWIAEVEDTGVKVRVMPAYQYFGSMAQAILVSDDTIAKRPEMVRAVVRATLHGLADVIADPKSAAHDYVAAFPAMKDREAFVEKVLKMYNEYVYQGQSTPGYMDPDRMAAVQKFYVSEGIVPKATPVDELYTNQFLP